MATSADSSLESFIIGAPKVELHIHLEGSLMPDFLFKLAERNGVPIRYKTVEAVEEAYNFGCLQDFLDLYYEGMSVLKTEEDFYDLAMEYLGRVNKENVRHVEVFFDPQPHMDRGVSFDVVVNGFHNALQEANKNWNLSSRLIMCFVRHLPVEHALRTLELSLAHRDKICAVGLDSTELGHPMEKFKELFSKAREAGFDCVAHAGEEGPAKYVEDALDLLEVKRIDHGIRSLESEELSKRLAKERVPLTTCPLSNCRLCVIDSMAKFPLRAFLDQGICCTINSDDPAYFGGYLTENFLALAREPALKVTKTDVIQLIENSIEATLLDSTGKSRLKKELDDYISST